MASAAFSFHCMICFEQFENSKLRYPVVLPCGHTYVCNSCAERLDKCMECRTPLFQIVQPPKSAPGPGGTALSTRSNWSSRSARTATFQNHLSPQNNSSTSPKQTPVKKRLPLPKNVVLLSLIEATEIASADVKSGSQFDQQPFQDGFNVNTGSLVDDEEQEEGRIQFATSVSTGVAGTYAVAVREGMDIYPSRPTSNSVGSDEEDVDTLVQFFHVRRDGEDLAHLAMGDRVQIVAKEGGWAKLARGYGYVRYDRNQIVKVGNPLDRACRLEAMLRTVSLKRQELRMKQSENDNRFIRIMNELQASLQTDEDLTVICGTAFAETGEMEVAPPADMAEEKKEPSPPPSFAREASDEIDLLKPPRLHPEREIESIRPGLMCFAPIYETHSGENSLRNLQQSFSMTDVAAGARRLLSSADAFPILPAVSNPSPSEMRAGAQAWRERQVRESRGGIDFRTGMSGHSALMSTHHGIHHTATTPQPHPQEVVETFEPQLETARSSVNFRMSSHTGLTMRKPKGWGPFFWGSQYGNPPSPSESEVNIPRTGSL